MSASGSEAPSRNENADEAWSSMYTMLRVLKVLTVLRVLTVRC